MMTSRRTGRDIHWFALGRAGLGAAAVFGAATLGLAGFLAVAGPGWQAAWAGSALAMLVGVGFIAWDARVRAVRRWNAALDAYADREILRESRRRGRTPRVGTGSVAATLSGPS